MRCEASPQCLPRNNAHSLREHAARAGARAASGEARSVASLTANAWRVCTAVVRARSRSPGSACSQNTTKPSSSLHRPCVASKYTCRIGGWIASRGKACRVRRHHAPVAFAGAKLCHRQCIRTRPASEARLRHSSSSKSPTAGTDDNGAFAASCRLACLLAKLRRLVNWQRGRPHSPQAVRIAATCMPAVRLPKQGWRRLCSGLVTAKWHGRLAQQARNNAAC